MNERDQPNLSPLMKETICWTKQLDTISLSHIARLREMQHAFQSSTDLPSIYFGDDSLGLMRLFPGRYTEPENCGVYDPRVRPWYTNSMSPPKDVVILIDISGSMWAHGALDHAVEVARYLIEHFSPTDSFALIAFGTRNTQIFPDGGGFARGTLLNSKSRTTCEYFAHALDISEQLACVDRGRRSRYLDKHGPR